MTKYKREVFPIGKGVDPSMGVVSWLDLLNQRLAEGWEIERVDSITVPSWNGQLSLLCKVQLYTLRKESEE